MRSAHLVSVRSGRASWSGSSCSSPCPRRYGATGSARETQRRRARAKEQMPAAALKHARLAHDRTRQRGRSSWRSERRSGARLLVPHRRRGCDRRHAAARRTGRRSARRDREHGVHAVLQQGFDDGPPPVMRELMALSSSGSGCGNAHRARGARRGARGASQAQWARECAAAAGRRRTRSAGALACMAGSMRGLRGACAVSPPAARSAACRPDAQGAPP